MAALIVRSLNHLVDVATSHSALGLATHHDPDLMQAWRLMRKMGPRRAMEDAIDSLDSWCRENVPGGCSTVLIPYGGRICGLLV
jgi:hypothetical protein